jgi:hypothetical protein
MASDTHSDDQLKQNKEFTLRDVGTPEAQRGLFKWCKVRARGKEFVPSALKYLEFERCTFTVETQNPEAGDSWRAPFESVGTCGLWEEKAHHKVHLILPQHYDAIIQKIPPLLDKIKKLLQRLACLR